ncbi:glycosyltransferase family 4 protein [Alterisphingorhabdus coralli]|uniref:Glycosyltransferase family 4 protein n=1 Tax=Alterisphingorhabdus coralli TaxID=3071408 RepID=A0AA97I118_9SPHN|nr:glycosyltransferase family 4 protein [Parasphingorhabdus sp. SCSIO 66989]WOE74805.1 glycosyltransferase family 4 protein [Parasphingorhabdus sp. SCSIO 66989]
MPLKIVYLHQYFNTPEMQGGTRSYEFAKRLVAKGHKVDLITSDRSPESKGKSGWRTTDEDGITVHWYAVPYSNEMGFFERVKAFFAFAYASTRYAISIDADIVFATSTPLTIAIPGILKKWTAKVPLVFEVRDLWPELPIAVGALKNPILKFAARLLESLAYKNSEAVVALSPGMRDGVLKTGYDPQRVCVIPNACDNESFIAEPDKIMAFRNARDWLGNNPLLLYAGTLGLINGVGYLVDVARHLQNIAPNVRLLIVGEGQERRKIHEQAIAAGVLNNNLFIENYLPKNEMATLFGAADISASLFIDLPEMRANSANKFFDTLAAGRPILINYGGWQAKIVSETRAGLVTWGMPIEDVANHIAEHIADEDWLKSASKSSKRLSQELFDRDKLADEFAILLEMAAQKKGDQVSKISQNQYD